MSVDAADLKRTLRSELMQRFRRERELEFSDEGPVAPCFRGADAAAARLASEPVFAKANVVFITLDRVLEPIRKRALELRKRLVTVAADAFLEVDPDAIPAAFMERAASSDGLPRFGRSVGAKDLPAVALVVAAAVAVDLTGTRLGDGTGSFDKAYGTLREAGVISVKSPVVSLIHRSQLVERPLPHEPFDTPIDLIVTPEHRLLTHTSHPRPAHRF